MKIKRPLNSLYIHIPFCKSKCYYCNFVSFAGRAADIESYIKALTSETGHYLELYRDINLKSIYIGGGTPSLVDAKYYSQIFETIRKSANIDKQAEITIEVNPCSVNFEYLRSLKEIGINRLSMGIQSFDDNILKLLNRQHNEFEAVKAVEVAKNAGFSNISIDLMYGLPTQTLNIWEETLHKAINLDIQHISTYGLKIEEGTRFGEKLPPQLPDEDLAAQMYLETIEILTDNGFNHYEISNFAKSGYASRHNCAYWKNEEYFGFGLSAHGYVDGIRYSNTSDLDKYILNPLERESAHQLSNQEIIEEAMFLGLRLMKGVSIEYFRQEYGADILDKYKAVIDKYIGSGHMELDKGHLRFTDSGILLSNYILADFLE